MQLKIRRSQRDGGIISTTAIFCLDARVEFTAEEQRSITKYKLQGQVIYNSEASKRLLEKSATQQDGSTVGSLKSLATIAFAATKLNISINGLQRGQHIECKSLDELLGAEDAIMTACENLKGYLDTALTFDGSEIVIDFNTGKPQLVAQSLPPQQLIAPPPIASDVTDAPIPRLSDDTADYAPHYGPDEDWTTRLSNFQPNELWDNPVYRKRMMIGAGIVLFLLLLHSCHML